VPQDVTDPPPVEPLAQLVEDLQEGQVRLAAAEGSDAPALSDECRATGVDLVEE